MNFGVQFEVELAQEIRRIDGNHTLGAARLAEEITNYLNECLALRYDDAEQAFDHYASKFDTMSDEWQDMGADDYFKAGFKAGRVTIHGHTLGATADVE